MNKDESMNIHVKKHSKNDLHNLVSMKGSYTNNHRLDAKWIECGSGPGEKMFSFLRE